MKGRTEIAVCGVRRDAVAGAERRAPSAESGSTRPLSRPDRLPPRRGGGSSPHTYAVSAAGRVGRHPFAHALLVTIALLLSGALAPPAAAQDRVLVSDLGTPPDIEGGYTSGAALSSHLDIPAQPFHVGADQGNYTLTSVEIPFVSAGIAAADIEKLSVSIWYSDSWDYELVNNELFTNVGFVGCPWPCQPVPLGYQLYTLENPPSIPDPPSRPEATTATFTAPEGAPLLAGKTYAVVVSYDKRKRFSERAPSWQTLETIVRVDATSAEGWDIPNENWCSPMVQPLCANASDATWQTADSNVHRLGVNGYVGSRFADDNVCPNPLSPPVSVRAYPTLPYQIHLGWWSPDTTHGARNRPVCYDYQYRYRILGANTWTSEWKTVAEEFLPSPNDTEIRNYNSLEVTDLIPGRTYEFQVRTVRGGPYSESVSILATAAGTRRISIEAASGPVTEGEPVRFTVSRHEPFGRANGRLRVFVTVSETGEMIERGRNWNYRNVEFADGQTTAELVLETVDDGDADEPDSEVTAKVRRSNAHPYGYLYEIDAGRGSATKTVTARGGTIRSSELSVADAEATEGEDETVSSDGNPGSEVTVDYRTEDGAAADLTASFVDMPETHNGETAFRFRVAFSEDIGISYQSLREDAFTVTGGRVTGGRRVDDRRDLFEMTVEPDGDGDVTITLEAGRECGVSGAICTKGANRRKLTNTPTATVAGPPASAPDKPTGLSATATHDSVTLTWDDPGDDSITGYVILRRVRVNNVGGEFDVLEANTGSAATTYTDNSVAASTTYTYRIKAINGAGTSERSRWFHIDTPAAPASKPAVADGPPGLAPNAPNPFNANTLIPYRLDADGPVRMEIYNLLGQSMRTLVDQYQDAGFYKVRWDARDRRGALVSAGMYLVRLHYPGGVQTQRLLYLK